MHTSGANSKIKCQVANVNYGIPIDSEAIKCFSVESSSVILMQTFHGIFR